MIHHFLFLPIFLHQADQNLPSAFCHHLGATLALLRHCPAVPEFGTDCLIHLQPDPIHINTRSKVTADSQFLELDSSARVGVQNTFKYISTYVQARLFSPGIPYCPLSTRTLITRKHQGTRSKYSVLSPVLVHPEFERGDQPILTERGDPGSNRANNISFTFSYHPVLPMRAVS